MNNDNKLPYSAVKEFLKDFGINPYEFRKLSGNKVRGWFPDLPDREPMIDINKLVQIFWGKE